MHFWMIHIILSTFYMLIKIVFTPPHKGSAAKQATQCYQAFYFLIFSPKTKSDSRKVDVLHRVTPKAEDLVKGRRYFYVHMKANYPMLKWSIFQAALA